MRPLLPCLLQVWECRSRIARTLIASKCLTAFRVGLVQYLSLLWLCLLAFLGLNLGAKAAMVRWVAGGLLGAQACRLGLHPVHSESCSWTQQQQQW